MLAQTTSTATPLTAVHLGLIDYREAYKLQKELAADRAADNIGNLLLLLEHPHTYTFGTKGKREHLLVPEADLRAAGVEVIDVDRGGDVTYHGPGQLVGYPILRLRDYGLRVVQYLRCLEDALIEVVSSYGLAAGRQRGYTGVWVGAAKVAAIGVKVDANGVTRHGFALNVAPDLRYFAQIIPCGIRDKAVGSLESLLDRPVTLEDATERTLAAFGTIFGPVIGDQVGLHDRAQINSSPIHGAL